MTKTGRKPEPARPRLPDWLGLRHPFDWALSRARPLGAFAGFLLGLTALLLVIIFFATLIDFAGAVTGLRTPAENFDMRGAGVLLAFLLGAPFVIWRTFVAARQAETAAEALFNEKLNAASEGLAARRQVTRVIGRGATQKVLNEWEDDLVSRATAIDRLEGLVHERPEAGKRIARLLSVYVVELSREHPPQKAPEGASPDEIRKWASTLRPTRTDMERAAQALGRLRRIPGVDFPGATINLRGTNLQGFDLSGLAFSGARLSGARMEGAGLWEAHLKGQTSRRRIWMQPISFARDFRARA